MSSLLSLAKSRLGKFLVTLGFSTPLIKFLPVKKVYEDNQILAFYHPKPFWEIHVVIVPKRQISSLAEVGKSDQNLQLEPLGWRLITNIGKYQKVKYLHFHLGAGKQIGTDEV